MTRLALAGLALLLGATGCYTTTIVSGRPIESAPVPSVNGRWQHGFVYGIVELEEPHDLSKLCPGGWGEITTETTALNGLVDIGATLVASIVLPGIAAAGDIYSLQSATLRCARGEAAATPVEAAATPVEAAAR